MNSKYNQVVGIDEAGRGCWAGPLVAGAVLLDSDIDGLRDSKRLTAKQRSLLAVTIKEAAAGYGIGWVSPQEIDSIGLTAATSLAMQRALLELTCSYQSIIIDGNYNYLPDRQNVITVIGADDSVPSVSAASILAKTARDAYMVKMAKHHPDYGFESHVGYGTKVHKESLLRHGPCEIHRLSYKPVKASLV